MELGLVWGEPPARGARRMVVEQADLAIELLDGSGAALRPETVHEVRKALKRLRALLRLLRGELGERTYTRESRVLRDVGRRLAGARDAEVMLYTLRDLMRRHPRKLRRKGIVRLERRLVLERENVRARTLTDTALRAEAGAELRAFRARASAWQLQQGAAKRGVESGLRRIYCTGRTRYRRAERGKGNRTQTLHEWRKSVKDLRYAGEALSVKRRPAPAAAVAAAAASNGSAAQHRGGPDGRGPRRMRRLARRADRVGELLGAEHDLAVLAELVSSKRRPLGVKLSRRSRKRLLRAIARRRRELRVRALRAGESLYGRSPKRLLRDARTAELRPPLS